MAATGRRTRLTISIGLIAAGALLITCGVRDSGPRDSLYAPVPTGVALLVAAAFAVVGAIRSP